MNPLETPLAPTTYIGHVKNGVVVFDDVTISLSEGQEVLIEPVIEGEYRHVPLQIVDTLRVRYAQPVPLEPRQHVIEDFDE